MQTSVMLCVITFETYAFTWSEHQAAAFCAAMLDQTEKQVALRN